MLEGSDLVVVDGFQLFDLILLRSLEPFDLFLYQSVQLFLFGVPSDEILFSLASQIFLAILQEIDLLVVQFNLLLQQPNIIPQFPNQGFLLSIFILQPCNPALQLFHLQFMDLPLVL